MTDGKRDRQESGLFLAGKQPIFLAASCIFMVVQGKGGRNGKACFNPSGYGEKTKRKKRCKMKKTRIFRKLLAFALIFCMISCNTGVLAAVPGTSGPDRAAHESLREESQDLQTDKQDFTVHGVSSAKTRRSYYKMQQNMIGQLPLPAGRSKRQTSILRSTV